MKNKKLEYLPLSIPSPPAFMHRLICPITGLVWYARNEKEYERSNKVNLILAWCSIGVLLCMAAFGIFMVFSATNEIFSAMNERITINGEYIYAPEKK